MKKIVLAVILTFFTISLNACYNPENNFNKIGTFDIPNEVTQDFDLPKGFYGDFVWTSNNEERIKINGNSAFVTQGDDDELVIITANFRKITKDYNILVLKKGSELSDYEKSFLHQKNNSNFEVNFNGLRINLKIDNIFVEYKLLEKDYYIMEKYEDYLYIVKNHSMQIPNHNIETIYYKVENGIKKIIYIGSTIFSYSNDLNINFKERKFNSYLKEDSTLIINHLDELEEYIDTLDNKVDENYLLYLLNLKDSGILSYTSLLLINTSNRNANILSINENEWNLKVNLEVSSNSDGQTHFVIETGKLKNNLKVNINKEIKDDSAFLIKAYKFNYSYLDDLYNDYSILDSYDSLLNCIEEANLNQEYSLLDKELYIKQLRNYSEDYFINNKLVLVNYNLGSGSFYLNYEGYEVEDLNLKLSFKIANPLGMGGTADVKPWNFIIEVNDISFDTVIIKEV